MKQNYVYLLESRYRWNSKHIPLQILLPNSFETLSFLFLKWYSYQDWKPIRFKQNRETLLLSISIATHISIRKEDKNITLDFLINGIFCYLNKTYSLASAEEQMAKVLPPTSLQCLLRGKREGRAWDQRSERRRGEANAANVLGPPPVEMGTRQWRQKLGGRDFRQSSG